MKETPISSTLLSRLTDASRYVISGITPASWFGPMQPQKPQAPEDVAGRRFDYPVGYNLNISTRASEPVTFDDLRALADACDILRSVIETRKDQMEALDWGIRVKPVAHGPDVFYKPTDDQKRRIDAVTGLLEYPDGEHSFAQWLRQILEDMFVIDAVAVYKRRNRAGQLCGLEVVDGASIRLLLGEDGRTPRAPDPAYQQILKGIPAVDYTRDELLYLKHNPRSHKIYGYSHVEQVLVTVNILIRRALHQLDYYREGSQPDALIGLPKEWSQDQIHGFQKHFDGVLAGNSALLRRVHFMPGDFKYQETKAPPLKDAYDEFIARIICFVFSVSPEPFVGQVNRSTAESSQARATAEGLAPLQRFVREMMNRIICKDMNCPDLEFVWQDTREQDPKEAAQIDVAYVGAGIVTPDEVRARMGLGALPKAEPVPVNKYNHNHDEQGRFATAQASGGGSGASSASASDDEEDDDDLTGDELESDELFEGEAGEKDYTNDSASSDPIGGTAIPIGIVLGAAELGTGAVTDAVISVASNAARAVRTNIGPIGSSISVTAGRAIDGVSEQVQEGAQYVADTIDGVMNGGKNDSDFDVTGKVSAEATNPQIAENTDWKLGGYKSAERWQNQMKDRGWTEEEITETLRGGEKFPANNDVNKGNPATRYENHETGKYLVRDEITKEIIQLGDKDFARPQFQFQNNK